MQRLPPSPRLPAASTLAAMFGCLTLATVLVVPFLQVVLDDPFITFRYAQNALSGHWGQWNIGEAPVEGFTSTLWMLISFAFLKANIHPYAGVKALGLASVAISIPMAFTLGNRMPGRLIAASTLALLVVACPDVLFYSAAGMEHIVTVPLGFALLLLLESSWRWRHQGLLALLTLYLFLRPEGHLVAACLASAVALVAFRDGELRGWLRSQRAFCALAAVCMAAPFAVRLLWFGEWFPNTYYAKHSDLGWLSIVDGAIYVGKAAPYYWALAAISLPLMAAPGRRTTSELASAAVCAGFFLYALKLGGDTQSAFPGSRLLLPMVPFLCFLASRGLATVTRETGSWRLAAPHALLLSGVLAALAPFYILEGLKSSLAMRNYEVESLGPLEVLARSTRLRDGLLKHFALSDYLLAQDPKREPVAMTWAGRAAFETGLPVIDMLGLNDKHIARTPRRQRGVDVRYDADYVLKRRPYLICDNLQMSSWHGSLSELAQQPDDVLYSLGAFMVGQRELLRHPWLGKHYEVAPSSPMGSCFRRTD